MEQALSSRPVVRRAVPADAGAVQSLFEVRNRSDDATAAEGRGPDLDNPIRRLWLAEIGERAVGMTSVQERQLRVGGQVHRVAYWTGLFVDPGPGNAFIYPQLVMGMFKGLREGGIHHLYAAVRRQQIAESHLRIGFRRIGTLRVLAKPLRPARLLARHRRLPVAAPGGTGALLRGLCALPDALAVAAIRLQGPRGATILEPMAATDHERLAGLYRDGTAGLVCQAWTPELLRSRYSSSAAAYELVWAGGAGPQSAAAVILRILDRPDGIRAAVLMDVVHGSGAERQARVALAAAERHALAAGCDVMVALGACAGSGSLLRSRGFIRTPEVYSLLAWTDRAGDPTLFPMDVDAWRFAFGDHDTF